MVFVAEEAEALGFTGVFVTDEVDVYYFSVSVKDNNNFLGYFRTELAQTFILLGIPLNVVTKLTVRKCK